MSGAAVHADGGAPFHRATETKGLLMTDRLKIAGISGSLRHHSYNTASLHALGELAPDGVELDVMRLHDLPLFDQDVEEQGWPAPVQALRDRIAPADGLIIATPEYNYSIPGVLKNAIDWLSRPEGNSPIFNKPVAIIGATPSMVGTARAQAHLRDIVFYNGLPLLATQEILIAKAGEKFDVEGKLTDQDTREHLVKLWDAFVPWVRQHSPA